MSSEVNPVRPAYTYVDSEKAQTLKNSKGSAKSRIHLLDYKGEVGKDRYAVFAEKLSDDAPLKLGWFDKKYFVLHEHVDENNNSTWYKINKNSLTKRLGVSSKDLEIDKKTGIVGDKLTTLVAAKQKELDDLNKRSGAKTPFELQFNRELVAAGVMKGYSDTWFWRFPDGVDRHTTVVNTGYTDETIKPWANGPVRSKLFMSYKQAAGENAVVPDQHLAAVLQQPDSPVVWLEINDVQYEEILSGKPISQEIIDKIDPKIVAKGVSADITVKIVNDAGETEEMKFAFKNAETRRSEIDKWLNKVALKAGNLSVNFQIEAALHSVSNFSNLDAANLDAAWLIVQIGNVGI